MQNQENDSDQLMEYSECSEFTVCSIYSLLGKKSQRVPFDELHRSLTIYEISATYSAILEGMFDMIIKEVDSNTFISKISM